MSGRYVLLKTHEMMDSDSFTACELIAANSQASSVWVIRDRMTGALFPVKGDPSPGHSVKAPPRTPQPGERWWHERMGEVEVLDAISAYAPDGVRWVIVQSPYSEDRRRWSVPPSSLIGRAE